MDQRPGHGRRLQAARRRRHDRALGVHATARSACKEIVDKDFKGKIDFVAQNVKTNDFGDPVFTPYVIREMQRRARSPSIGQAFPYTPIANPRCMVADWSFGIQDDEHAEDGRRGARQGRAGGRACCRTTAWTSTCKMAGARRAASTPSSAATPTTACRQPMLVGERRRHDAGDQRRQQRQVPRRARLRRQGRQDRRLPLQAAAGVRQPARRADAEMAALHRARCARRTRPSSARSSAVTDGLLYRRGNFNGTFDQLICDAHAGGAGRRDRLLAGLPLGHERCCPAQAITVEHVMDQTAITYPYCHRQRDDRRDDQDRARGRRRQPLQPRPLLPAGRRHGARRRPAATRSTPTAADGRAHLRHDALDRQADRRRPRPTRSPAGPAVNEGTAGRSRSGMCWRAHVERRKVVSVTPNNAVKVLGS
ncbi:MAG: hypothetical protein MZV49_22740 [Rhodopseudomonas palustris]|nr:hypothetical protein [Rhodopseudomonas palustris]